MVERSDYLSELERDIRVYTLTNRLLDSLGYSSSNRLKRQDFDGFVEKAKKEENGTYTTLENIVGEIEQAKQPKSLGRKIGEYAFNLFTLPTLACFKLRDQIWSKTRSRAAGVVSMGLACMGLYLFFKYAANNYITEMPRVRNLVKMYIPLQLAAFCIKNWDRFTYNTILAEPTGLGETPQWERHQELYGKILNKTEPNYEFMTHLTDHLKNQKVDST